METMFTINASTLDKVESKVREINEVTWLVNSLKQDNAWLWVEEKAVILRDFINSSAKVKTTTMKNSDSELIVWNWMIWYNVISTETNKRIGTIRAFDNDAKVVFTPYWQKINMNLWRLTSKWVVSINRS